MEKRTNEYNDIDSVLAGVQAKLKEIKRAQAAQKSARRKVKTSQVHEGWEGAKENYYALAVALLADKKVMLEDTPIYAAMDETSNVIGMIPKKAQPEIINFVYDWIEVEMPDGRSGYCTAADSWNGRNIADAWIYSEMDKTGKTLGTGGRLNAKKKVEHSKWCKVYTKDGRKGYILSDNIDFIDPTVDDTFDMLGIPRASSKNTEEADTEECEVKESL